jgi:hypothetical protein
MRLNEARAGLFVCRVDLSKELGAKPGAAWVELREPSEGEMDEYVQIHKDMTPIELMNANKENIKLVKGLWKKCLINHNFTNEEDKMAAMDEVIKFIESRQSLAFKVMNEWAGSLPLRQKSADKSKNSPTLDSTEDGITRNI